MIRARLRIVSLATLSLAALAATAPGATDAPAAAVPTIETLIGAWAGHMTHDGQEASFAMELEPAGDGPADEGKVLVRWTVPAMNLSRVPVGTVEPRIEGNHVTLGPLVLEYDATGGTLTGTMPPGMVPVYAIPVTLARVDAIEPLQRGEPAATRAAPLWAFDAGAPLWPGATFARGLVYAGDDAGVLHALNAETGERLWSFTAGGPIRTRPTVADGSLFFQADDGLLYRLDAASGREFWRVRLLDSAIDRRPPGDPQSRYDSFGSDVTAAGGRLYVGTHDGRLVALDPRDGSVLWQHQVEGSVLAAPAVAGGRIYFGAFDGQVHALDASTGAALWATDTRGAVLSTPAIAGGHVIVGNRSYDILALDAATGEVAWKRYVWFSWIESSATVDRGVAYIGSSDAAAALALSVETGEILWRTDVRGWSWGQPAVTPDRLFVQTAGMRGYQADNHQGGVMALERASGNVVWRYAGEPPEEGVWGFAGSPAVGAGKVFAAGLDGRLLAFEQ